MSTNIELVRNHTGDIDMRVAGVPAHGARVTGVQKVDDELAAVIVVPLKHATLAEHDNVVAFKRAG